MERRHCASTAGQRQESCITDNWQWCRIWRISLDVLGLNANDALALSTNLYFVLTEIALYPSYFIIIIIIIITTMIVFGYVYC